MLSMLSMVSIVSTDLTRSRQNFSPERESAALLAALTRLAVSLWTQTLGEVALLRHRENQAVLAPTPDAIIPFTFLLYHFKIRPWA